MTNLSPADLEELAFSDFAGARIEQVAEYLYATEPQFMAALEADIRVRGLLRLSSCSAAISSSAATTGPQPHGAPRWPCRWLPTGTAAPRTRRSSTTGGRRCGAASPASWPPGGATTRTARPPWREQRHDQRGAPR